ncbi:DUF3726 domain-containing protein [Sneathiella marina]|uniref:DUF3726 domain-containing protein n=1 Tax=Sneathiella marina TaxID=2950108 RepID=A0ABY4W119_9PROT|nr:DUF3726 domain-containing protein [Sneathiella marina]USG60667.1 DUF3726 domain-containing protein [Sneathiella marina]
MASRLWCGVMTYSLNEIGSLFRKAGIGAGLPSGLAEDVSRAGLWLLVRGLAGDEAVFQGIHSFKPHKSRTRTEGKDIKIDPFCSALDGLSVFDLAAASPSGFRASLRKIDTPMLLLGMAGIAAKDYGLQITIEFSNQSSFSIDANGSISTDVPVPGQGVDAVLTCGQNGTNQEKPQKLNPTVHVQDRTHKELLKLAAKTYVPATAASREKGAGAGLTDND